MFVQNIGKHTYMYIHIYIYIHTYIYMHIHTCLYAQTILYHLVFRLIQDVYVCAFDQNFS